MAGTCFPDQHGDIVSRHHSQAKESFRLYRASKDESKLESGIEQAGWVVWNASTTSKERLEMTWMLAHYLDQRHEHHQGEETDIQRSVSLFYTWMTDAPTDHFERPFVSCLLAGVLARRFEISRDRNDLEEALQLAYRAVELSALDPTLHLVYLRTVEEQLGRLWKNYEEAGMLERLIQARRDVLEESTKRGDKQTWRDMDDLGRSLFQSFQRTGNLEHLREALPLARAACDGMPEGFLRGCNMFSHLSNVLASFVEAGMLPLSGLEESIEMLHKAMGMSPIDMRDRVGLLVNLTNRHREAHQQGKSVQHLHRAIAYGKEAVKLSSGDDPELPMRRHGLAVCLSSLFESTGQQHLLDEAIEINREALEDPNIPDEDKALIASSVAINLQRRYETSSAAADLEEAVSRARDAVKWTPVANQYRALRLNTLGTSLSRLYSRTKRQEDLDEAIDCAREAVSCSWDKVDEGMYFSNLSTKLSKRYEAEGSEGDRIEALQYARKAVEATSNTGNSKYALYTNNLSNEIFKEYQSTKDSSPAIEKLEESIRLLEVSLQCTAETHTDWSDYAYWLAWRQMEFATCANDEETGWARFDRSIETFKMASMALGGSAIQRLRAGRVAALLLMTRERWAEANDISKETLKLLSYASPRSMSREDMQHRLSGLSNLSTISAAASLNSGETPEEALTTLEMGRGLIAGSLIGSRADLSLLNAVDSDACSQYQDLLEQLSLTHISDSQMDFVQHGPSGTEDQERMLPEHSQRHIPNPQRNFVQHRPSGTEDQNQMLPRHSQTHISDSQRDIVRHRQDLMKQLSGMEDKIRMLPELSRFQLPASGEQLKQLASEGPLVCFNVTGFRSDALIVTTEKIEAIPLPLLHEKDLKKHSQAIVGKKRVTQGTVTQRRGANVRLAKILIWLWNVAAKPVLDHLHFSGHPGSPAADLPRIWWVGSGQMGLMPLHAAGSKWEDCDENTASRAVSSYVHTLKALAYSRDSKRRAQPPPRSILAVEAPGIPEAGWVELNTKQEMGAIRDTALAAGVPSTLLSRPTASSVLKSVRNNTVVHFACHGSPDFLDPSKMSLVLCKDAHTPDLLSVSQLFDEKHEHAELAYLSACCTGQQYAEGLLDEGIHLGSAFQLMGFPSVVATLWEADDTAAADVAAAFYGRLLKGVGGDGHVARCLHDALIELRAQKFIRGKKKSDDILAWAPFIHIGI